MKKLVISIVIGNLICLQALAQSELVTPPMSSEEAVELSKRALLGSVEEKEREASKKDALEEANKNVENLIGCLQDLNDRFEVKLEECSQNVIKLSEEEMESAQALLDNYEGGLLRTYTGFIS